MHLAAIPSLLFALATSFIAGVILPPGQRFGIVTVILGGSGALLLYLLLARALEDHRGDQAHLRPAHPPGPVGRVLAGHRVRDR